MRQRRGFHVLFCKVKRLFNTVRERLQTDKQRRAEERRARDRRARDRDSRLPEALPNIRPRTLTPAPPASSSAPQPCSLLLTRLPPEIRRIIWMHCVGKCHIHIVGRGRRLGSEMCHMTTQNLQRWVSHGRDYRACDVSRWDCETMKVPLLQQEDPLPSRTWSDHWRLSLIKTCRMVYSETIDILYTQNLMHIINIDVMLSLQRALLPARFQTIRRLRFHWHLCVEPYEWHDPDNIVVHTDEDPPNDLASWEQACGVIASMSGLRGLEVIIEEFPWSTWPTSSIEAWKPILDPLRNVKQIKNFEVLLLTRMALHVTHVNFDYDFSVRMWWSSGAGLGLARLPRLMAQAYDESRNDIARSGRRRE